MLGEVLELNEQGIMMNRFYHLNLVKGDCQL